MAQGPHPTGPRQPRLPDPGAAGYFDYFGTAAGRRSPGYYSFNLGRWHLIALNSECAQVGGCATGSPQERWLRADLAAPPARCVLAYWHKPRFSSGMHGNNATYTAFWQALHGAGADVVLVGHDHDYERFAPQTPHGRADPARGIRQFVVGTGGKTHYGFRTIRANSQVRNSRTFGVLRLALHPAGYDWRFVPNRARPSPTAATAAATEVRQRLDESPDGTRCASWRAGRTWLARHPRRPLDLRDHADR